MADEQQFATVDDLQQRWRVLDSTEQARATVLLADASDQMRAELPDLDQRIADGKTTVRAAMVVCCLMVRRAMQTPGGDVPEGATQVNQTTGPFSTGFSFASSDGSSWLTKADKRRLGYRRGRAFEIDLLGASSNG